MRLLVNSGTVSLLPLVSRLRRGDLKPPRTGDTRANRRDDDQFVDVVGQISPSSRPAGRRSHRGPLCRTGLFLKADFAEPRESHRKLPIARRRATIFYFQQRRRFDLPQRVAVLGPSSSRTCCGWSRRKSTAVGPARAHFCTSFVHAEMEETSGRPLHAPHGDLAEIPFLLRAELGDFRQLVGLLALGCQRNPPPMEAEANSVRNLRHLLGQVLVFRISGQQLLTLQLGPRVERIRVAALEHPSAGPASVRPRGSVCRSDCRRVRSATSRLNSMPLCSVVSNQCSNTNGWGVANTASDSNGRACPIGVGRIAEQSFVEAQGARCGPRCGP